MAKKKLKQKAKMYRKHCEPWKREQIELCSLDRYRMSFCFLFSAFHRMVHQLLVEKDPFQYVTNVARMISVTVIVLQLVVTREP